MWKGIVGACYISLIFDERKQCQKVVIERAFLTLLLSYSISPFTV